MLPRLLLAGLVLTVLCLTTPAFAVDPPPPAVYQFVSVTLPTLTGDSGLTVLLDLNDAGDILVGFSDASRPGVLLQHGLRVQDLDCPEGGTGVQPQAINARGDFVGTCAINGAARSFLRSRGRRHGPHRVRHRLLDVLDATRTEVSGLNDQGDAVGDFQDLMGKFHGFLFDGEQFDLIDAPFPDTVATALTSLNNRGMLVGYYDTADTIRHGLVGTEDGFSTLDVPDAILTAPTDVNDAGTIVGIYVGADGVLRSFVREEGGPFATLAVPFTGAMQTEVLGMNNRGQLVGFYVMAQPGNDAQPFGTYGFVATPGGKEPYRDGKDMDGETLKRWREYETQRGQGHSKGRRHWGAR